MNNESNKNNQRRSHRYYGFNLVQNLRYIINECDLFPNMGSNYANSSYKCQTLVIITRIQVFKFE